MRFPIYKDLFLMKKKELEIKILKNFIYKNCLLNKQHITNNNIISFIEKELINKYQLKIKRAYKLFLINDFNKIWKSIKVSKDIFNPKITKDILLNKQLIVYKDSSLLDYLLNPKILINEFKTSFIRQKCNICNKLFGINFKEHIFINHNNNKVTIRDFNEVRSIISIHYNNIIYKLKVKNITKIIDIKKYLGRIINISVRLIQLKTFNRILKNKELIGEILDIEFLLFFKK